MDTTFTISNPTLKKGPVFKYTSYEIKSTTKRDNTSSEHLVNRRYSDFLWLHETLRKHNSGSIIPPLPKKQFIGRFLPLFIDNRIRGMEKFLSKVISHPVLGQELYVHTFLETNDFTQAKLIAESCQSNDGNSGGVVNWLETQKNVLTASESSMVKSQVVVETEARILPILEHMATAVKHSPKAVESCESWKKQQSNISVLRRKHGDACSSLQWVEEEDPSGAPLPSLGQFSASEVSLANITDMHLHSLDMEVIEPLQRHVSTVFALRASVTSQSNKRANHVAANSAIQRDSVRNPNHEEQVAKADRCLNEYVDASNRLEDDFLRYQEERNDDLLLLLHSLANLQVQHCKNAQVVWTELEAALLSDFPQDSGVPSSPTPPATVLLSPQHTHQPSSSLLDLEDDEEGDRESFYESV